MNERCAGDPPELVGANRRLFGMPDWKPRFADIDTVVTHALNCEPKLPRSAKEWLSAPSQ
jgi:UDP-glucose 4-epimerase